MGMHLVRRPTLTPITVNVNGARDRNRVRDNAASTRDVRTHDLKNKREKGKEEQAIECSFFLESCGCTASSNDQRSRSNRASSTPEILVNPTFPPVPGFVLGADTKLHSLVAVSSNIFTGLERSNRGKVNCR